MAAAWKELDLNLVNVLLIVLTLVLQCQRLDLAVSRPRYSSS